MKQRNVWIWDVLSHATIVLSMMFIVFFCIDRVNPAMDFLGSTLSKWVLLLFCLCALALGVVSALFIFRARRRQARRRVEKTTGGTYDA